MDKTKKILTLKTTFESSHSVPEKNGAKESVHGHSWEVSVSWIIKNNIDEKIRNKCNQKLVDIVKELNYNCLNEIELFKYEKPTAEIVAGAIFKNLHESDNNVILVSVQIEEEPGCSSIYINPLLDKNRR